MSGNKPSSTSANSYWRANLKILSSLLCIWFIASFGAGILFVDALDTVRFGGFKLGFWMSQQGSILVFVVLILVYIRLMDRLDAKYSSDAAAEKMEERA